MDSRDGQEEKVKGEGDDDMRLERALKTRREGRGRVEGRDVKRLLSRLRTSSLGRF